MIKISEDKVLKITYGALGILGALLFGFAAWMTSVELQAKENKESIVEMKDDYRRVGDAVISIDKRLSRIEILLERTLGRK